MVAAPGITSLVRLQGDQVCSHTTFGPAYAHIRYFLFDVMLKTSLKVDSFVTFDQETTQLNSSETDFHFSLGVCSLSLLALSQ